MDDTALFDELDALKETVEALYARIAKFSVALYLREKRECAGRRRTDVPRIDRTEQAISDRLSEIAERSAASQAILECWRQAFHGCEQKLRLQLTSPDLTLLEHPVSDEEHRKLLSESPGPCLPR